MAIESIKPGDSIDTCVKKVISYELELNDDEVRKIPIAVPGPLRQ
jgi:hypothetical protein